MIKVALHFPQYYFPTQSAHILYLFFFYTVTLHIPSYFHSTTDQHIDVTRRFPSQDSLTQRPQRRFALLGGPRAAAPL